MEKMTYVKALEVAINAVADNAEVAEKLAALKESVAKKNSAKSGKPTKNQIANDGYKAEIVANLEADKLYTVTEIGKAIPSLAEFSNQKVSSLVSQLVENGELVKTIDKRRSYFSLPKEDEE